MQDPTALGGNVLGGVKKQAEQTMQNRASKQCSFTLLVQSLPLGSLHCLLSVMENDLSVVK